MEKFYLNKFWQFLFYFLFLFIGFMLVLPLIYRYQELEFNLYGDFKTGVGWGVVIGLCSLFSRTIRYEVTENEIVNCRLVLKKMSIRWSEISSIRLTSFMKLKLIRIKLNSGDMVCLPLSIKNEEKFISLLKEKTGLTF